jgi:hemolysin activation/secretion protein
MATRLSALSLLLFLLVPSVAFSDVTLDAIEKREQLEKQKEVFERLEQHRHETTPYLDVDKPELLPDKDEACFETRSIQETSITLLSYEEKQRLIRAYTGRCNTLTDLTNLTRQLTALYIDKGYITSQVYLKPQNIAHGDVTLYAIEGTIESITPEGFYADGAFWGQKNRTLDLRNLERGIETINRLRSNHATMELAPGSEAGLTHLIIRNQPSRRIHGSLGLNNFGTKKTGDIQGTLGLILDNPLRINDQFSVYLNSTNRHFGDENSIGDTYAYSFPVGKLLTTLSYRKSSYKQLVTGGVSTYKSNGDTETYTLALDYKLYHDQNNRISLGSFVSRYESTNYISDALIETSSYTLSKAGGGLDYLYQTAGFYASLSLQYTQGVDWFNAHNPTDLDEKYSLYTVDISLVKRFAAFQYTLSTHHQHSKDRLFSTNQISIGGPYSVRGYSEEGLSGNSGYYIRNELSYSPEGRLVGFFDQTYFIALDGGRIKKEEDTYGGSLLSDTVGIKLRRDAFDLTVYYAMPLYKKDVSSTKNFLGFMANYWF